MVASIIWKPWKIGDKTKLSPSKKKKGQSKVSRKKLKSRISRGCGDLVRPTLPRGAALEGGRMERGAGGRVRSRKKGALEIRGGVVLCWVP